LAPAIGRVDGMPHPELIFLHSESADGCNARRVPAPPLGSDLKIASKLSCRLHKQIPTAADVIEDEVQEALAIYGGDMEVSEAMARSMRRLRANAAVASTLGSSGFRLRISPAVVQITPRRSALRPRCHHYG
jgi:hypothetical protein